jgi:hypothetical protein
MLVPWLKAVYFLYKIWEFWLANICSALHLILDNSWRSDKSRTCSVLHHRSFPLGKIFSSLYVCVCVCVREILIRIFWALHLPGRHSITGATPLSLFCISHFSNSISHLRSDDLNCDTLFTLHT